MPLTTVDPRSTNIREVLLSVRAALIAGLSDIFPEEAVMLADPDEWIDGAPEQQISTAFLTISLTEANLPDDVQVGGGAATTEQLAAVAVTIFTDSRLDQTGQMAAALFDKSEGLLELQRRVMRALVGTDLIGDNVQSLLSQLTAARIVAKPRRNPQGIWFTTLVFGVSFFWDLN